MMKTIQSKWTSCYIAYMMTVFVWYSHYKYFDIMQAKRSAFLLGAGIYVIGMTLLSAGRMIKDRTPVTELFQGKYYKIALVMVLVWILAIPNAADAGELIFGYAGKCTGLLVYALGILAACYVGSYLTWTAVHTWILVISCACVFLMQCLNRWGLDPFAMYDEMVQTEIRLFLGPIGQVNYNAAFDVMMLSVFMCLYLNCRKRLSQFMYGICILLGFMGAICCCSDSVYLGIAAVFFVLFWYVVRCPEQWNRYAQMILFFAAALVVIWFIYTFISAPVMWDVTHILMYTGLLIKVLGVLLAFVAAGTAANVFTREKSKKSWRILCGIIAGAGTIIVLIGAARFVTGWSDFAVILEWFGYRLTIWDRAVLLFENGNLWQKFFGYGFNNVSQALAVYGLDDMGGTVIADMHSIFLNTLVTSGIFGCLTWAWLITALLKHAVTGLTKKEDSILVVIGLAAYFAQGTVNGPQILTTPVFLTELGIFMNL